MGRFFVPTWQRGVPVASRARILRVIFFPATLEPFPGAAMVDTCGGIDDPRPCHLVNVGDI